MFHFQPSAAASVGDGRRLLNAGQIDADADADADIRYQIEMLMSTVCRSQNPTELADAAGSKRWTSDDHFVCSSSIVR